MRIMRGKDFNIFVLFSFWKWMVIVLCEGQISDES